MTQILNCGWDTETYLIGAPDNIIPPLVCSTYDLAPAGTRFNLSQYRPPGEDPNAIYRAAGSTWTHCDSTGDFTLFEHMLEMWQMAYQEELRIIIQNAAFDLTVGLRYAQEVAAGTRPGDRSKAMDLFMLIWEVLEKSLDNEWENCTSPDPVNLKNRDLEKPILVSDTIIRDKLYFLSTYGSISYYGSEEEGGREVRRTLADFVKRYWRINIFDAKVSIGKNGRILDHEGNDITGTHQAAAAWRLRYKELDGIPSDRWEPNARDYAIRDATWARCIWEEQESIRQPLRHGSMNSEALQVYSDTSLRLATSTGFRVDRDQVKRLTQMLAGRLNDIEPHLRANGMLRSNGSQNKKVIKGLVAEIWDSMGQQPLLTDKGEIATNKEVMEIIAAYSPHLQLYSEYNGLAKIRDAFLPALTDEKVYTDFDILKETGRTSSRGSGKPTAKRTPIYKAVNSQQIPRKAGVRESFLPPPPDENAPNGYVLCSADYGAMELCSVAQVTYNLFGASVHRDKINAGYDLHSFLGSSISRNKDPELVDFKTSPDEAYKYLYAKAKANIPDDDTSPEAEQARAFKKRAKNMRSLSKPIGLGYPGGLGISTMCVFAKTVYGVEITEEESAECKELWLKTYPEMVEYFKWVEKQKDFRNKWKDGHNAGEFKLCYETDGFRRFRAGASFCAVSNGKSMQSLGADGAKRSVAWIGRACSGGAPRQGHGCEYSILDACFFQTFIHDELLVAIPKDELLTERALAVQELMIDAMQPHMPDIRLSAEPACMNRWIKAAEPEWIESTTERGAALARIERQYGSEVAYRADDHFRPENPSMRLIAWDDAHKAYGLDPEHMLT